MYLRDMHLPYSQAPHWPDNVGCAHSTQYGICRVTFGALRGILAALDLNKRIKEGNHRVSVGVTTGDLLCTCVGARKIRSEYTVFGGGCAIQGDGAAHGEGCATRICVHVGIAPISRLVAFGWVTFCIIEWQRPSHAVCS